MPKQIFVNLPVKDLNKAKEFFAKLGFKFDPKFTDENATCMIISENIYAMLLVEKFFKTFAKKEINDSTKNTEVLLALTAESKEEVDNLFNLALNAGATEARALQDEGWMYSKSFEDIDKHTWEIIWMDTEKFEEAL